MAINLSSGYLKTQAPYALLSLNFPDGTAHHTATILEPTIQEVWSLGDLGYLRGCQAGELGVVAACASQNANPTPRVTSSASVRPSPQEFSCLTFLQGRNTEDMNLSKF